MLNLTLFVYYADRMNALQGYLMTLLWNSIGVISIDNLV